MESMLAILAGAFAPILGAIATGLVSWGAIEVTKYVKAKTKNEAANDAISHICHTVETTVANLNQTLVPALQKASADGKLTANDADYLKAAAIQSVKNQLPTAIENSARLAVNSVNDLVEAKIEQAVGEHKSYGTILSVEKS